MQEVEGSTPFGSSKNPSDSPSFQFAHLGAFRMKNIFAFLADAFVTYDLGTRQRKTVSCCEKPMLPAAS